MFEMTALEQSVSFGPYRLDPREGLTRGGRPLHLTPKALRLLCLLASQRGRLMTKEELFDALWPGAVVGDTALVTCIQELRQALKDDARRPRYIETLHRRGYRFIAPTAAKGYRAEVSRAPDPEQGILVGREDELAQLDEALSQAQAGARQLVLISGDAGIGKTTLVRAFLSRAAQAGDFRIALGQTAENYGATEAYHPLIEALMRACRGVWGVELMQALDRYAPLWLAQMPALVGPTRLRALQRRTAGATPERMQRELTDALEAAAEVPIVLCLEDLHWSDVSTIDWLASFARRPERVPFLVVGTYRPGEASAGSRPIHAIRDELRRQGRSRDILLGPLSSFAVGQYIAARFASRAENAAPLSKLAADVYSRTEGSPLFMVGVLNELVARGVLACEEGLWSLRGAASAQAVGIPQDLRHAIERQFDRLEPSAVRLLQIASAAGFDFSVATVAAAAGLPIEEVEDRCSELSRGFRFLRAGGTEEWPDGSVASRFGFVHALYRDALYERLPAGRRADLHRRIGGWLETRYGDRAGEIAPQLAMHFAQGRDIPRAILYFREAGQTAVARSASHEAATHFERALELLESLPHDGARDELEAALRLSLSVALVAVHGMGSPHVEDCAGRARVLCERIGDASGRFLAHRVLWNHSLMRYPVPQTLQRARELVDFAGETKQPVEMALAHRALGCSLIYDGQLREADRVLARGVALADAVPDFGFSPFGEHPGMICRVFGAWAKSLMGFPEEANRLCDSGIEHARRRDDAHGLAYALVTAGIVYIFQRDAAAAERVATEVLALSREYKLPQWVAFGHEIEGWAACQSGDRATGIERMNKALAHLHATGARTHTSRILANLVEAHLAAGDNDVARTSLDAAFAHRAEHGEHYYAPELHRLRAQVLERDGAAFPEIELSLRQALDIARRQGQGLLELRAARTLGRHWSAQGRAEEAQRLIEPLCRPSFQDGKSPGLG
jgi:DNA-binding winged helix-turn-helix (wHTH) protein/tetratricopeptide (TPR) repeat protein